jgi:hypothetical protein
VTFLDIALAHIARGWTVFPCHPKTKKPLIDGGEKWANASGNVSQVRAWWTKWPDANVAVAGNGSGIAVLDVDHGLLDQAAWRAWCERNGIPETYTVRTGRRPEFGAQMYFAGAVPDVGTWQLDGCSGQVKSAGGYVMAAGCIHPDSRERYAVICDMPVVPLPDVVRNLRKPVTATSNNSKVPKTAWNLPVQAGENRTGFLLEQTGAMRNLGCGKDAILARMIELNEDPEIIAEPVDHERLDSTAENCAKFPLPEQPPIVELGKPEKTVTDWRSYYHNTAEHDSVGPPSFLIENFLPEQSIMGIGAFVGQKKTLAALNIVFSLCSGESLFGKYRVTRKPARVLYLGPENGLISFSDRVNRIGLRDYLCKSFFYSTMSMQENRPLISLMPEEVQDAAIVIDTAIRFTDGSENDAAMMKEFAKHAFSLIRNKAACVIMLHHSPKSMTKANELTLENSFRGTGELSAFLSVALAMRTQDMEDEYGSASLFRFVKQRDFEPSPSSFEVKTSRETCRMTFVDGSAGATVTLGNTANKDGKDDTAVELMKANRKLSGVKMAQLLKDAGITRSKEWVRLKRGELGLGGVKTGNTL